MAALATVLSFVVVYRLPNGDSISAASMAPIIFVALTSDLKTALLTSLTYSLVQMMIDRGEFVEYDAHMKNFYGTPKSQLDEKLQKGHVILDIEPNGAFAVRKARQDAVLIFIAPPSLE